MKKILLAIDNTPTCHKAAEFVIDFFGNREDCTISIIYVKTPIILYGEVALASYEEIEQRENQECDTLIATFREFFRHRCIPIQEYILEGEAVAEVIACAKDFDLLVIGESKDSFWNKIFSSNQETFSQKSPIPILIFKG